MNGTSSLSPISYSVFYPRCQGFVSRLDRISVVLKNCKHRSSKGFAHVYDRAQVTCFHLGSDVSR